MNIWLTHFGLHEWVHVFVVVQMCLFIYLQFNLCLDELHTLAYNHIPRAHTHTYMCTDARMRMHNTFVLACIHASTFSQPHVPALLNAYLHARVFCACLQSHVPTSLCACMHQHSQTCRLAKRMHRYMYSCVCASIHPASLPSLAMSYDAIPVSSVLLSISTASPLTCWPSGSSKAQRAGHMMIDPKLIRCLRTRLRPEIDEQPCASSDGPSHRA